MSSWLSAEMNAYIEDQLHPQSLRPLNRAIHETHTALLRLGFRLGQIELPLAASAAFARVMGDAILRRAPIQDIAESPDDVRKALGQRDLRVARAVIVASPTFKRRRAGYNARLQTHLVATIAGVVGVDRVLGVLQDPKRPVETATIVEFQREVLPHVMPSPLLDVPTET